MNPRSPLRAVLDTNVFVRMILSTKPEGVAAALWWCLQEGAFQLLSSDPLLAELRETLLDPELATKHGWTDRRVDEYVASLREIATVVPGTRPIDLPALAERDPTDIPVVVAGIEGDAEVIVTQDADLLDDPDLRDSAALDVVDPLAFLRMVRSRMAGT